MLYSPKKSTIDRADLPPQLRRLRSLLAVPQRIAPRVAARIALRAWMTPPPPRADRRSGPAGGRVDRIDVGHTVLELESWGDGPPVYLLHGWGGWRGQLAPLVEPLVSAGFRVLAVDAPGHGGSGPSRFGPNRSTMIDFVDAINAATEHGGEPAAIIGHSLGGSASALAVAEGQRTDRLVTIGSPPQPLEPLTAFTDAIQLTGATRTAMISRLEQLAGRSMDEFDLLRRPAPAAGTLIIHDRDDREIAYRGAELLSAAWPAAELCPTSGLGHRRILRDPDVVQHVVDFVAR